MNGESRLKRFLFFVLWMCLIGVWLFVELTAPTNLLYMIICVALALIVLLVFLGMYRTFKADKKKVEEIQGRYIDSIKPKPLKMYGYYQPDNLAMSRFADYQKIRESQPQSEVDDELVM